MKGYYLGQDGRMHEVPLKNVTVPAKVQTMWEKLDRLAKPQPETNTKSDNPKN